MTLSRLNIPPGINSDRSDYSLGPVWKTGDKVRFEQNDPEPIGGWEALTDYNATGVPSNVIIWRDLSGNDLMAVGTEQRLAVVKNGTIFDITPVRAETDPLGNDPLTTASGSAAVTVNDTAHGAAAGDYAVMSGAATTNGIPDTELNAAHQITSITDDDNFVITVTTTASSTGTGGGASVKVEYLLGTGVPAPTAGLGWGAGTWNESGTTWGTARTTSTVTLDANTWSFDLWGEDLIANRRDGGIYTWDASVGTGTRATAVTNAPSTNKFIMTSVPDRHLISFGAHDGSASDPLNIRWTDQEVNTTWTAAAGNTAGSQRVHIGDKVVAAVQTRDQIIFFTDAALFGMIFSGAPFTFTFRHLATEKAPVGPNAAVHKNSMVFWMSKTDFHLYNGTAQVLPCPVRDHVFDDINLEMTDLVHAGTNDGFSEIWWHYPSSSSADYPDRYVVLDYVTNEWAFGTLGRTVWKDASSWQDNPIAYDSSGNFYLHEKGKNANGAALSWSIESGTLEVPEAGDQFFLVEKFITDVSQQTGDVTLTVYYRRYSNATESSKTYTISSTTEKTSARIRGRQLRLGYSSSEVESFAKLGILRADWRPSGRR